MPILSITTISLVLNVLLNLVKNLTDNTVVDDIIAILEGWLPTIMSEASQLLPLAQNIISTLQGSSVLTAEQIAAVDALNAQADTGFDAAAANAMAATAGSAA